MVTEYLLFVIGLLLLIVGANLIVNGATRFARIKGIPTVIVGITIVSLGTTLPELTIALFAGFKGQTDIALGNAIGTVIANSLLILGIAALIRPLYVQRFTITKQVPFVILSVVVLLILSNVSFLDNASEQAITRSDGLILLLFLLIFFYYTYESVKSHYPIKEINSKKNNKGLFKIFFSIIAGSIAIYLGGKWTVDSAVIIARNLGIGEFLISATIIAVGTSLPELMTAIIATCKKKSDIAIGNVIGANILNILWVLGLAAIISPVPIPEFVNFDIFFMLASTLILLGIIYIGSPNKINRWEGSFMIGLYAAYMIFLLVRG
jgi:cation:H+ antiporter